MKIMGLRALVMNIPSITSQFACVFSLQQYVSCYFLRSAAKGSLHVAGMFQSAIAAAIIAVLRNRAPESFLL